MWTFCVAFVQHSACRCQRVHPFAQYLYDSVELLTPLAFTAHSTVQGRVDDEGKSGHVNRLKTTSTHPTL